MKAELNAEVSERFQKFGLALVVVFWNCGSARVRLGHVRLQSSEGDTGPKTHSLNW